MTAQVPRSAKPFISINMAMTADGKIAFDDGRFEPFGSPHDHEHLLQLRAAADAVMSGARTVGSYPVNLGPGPKRFRQKRLRAGLDEYNLRIVVSGSARLSPRAEIFRHRFSPIIVLATARAPTSRLKALERAGAHIEVCGTQHLDFELAMRRLRSQWGVQTLLCEGGGAVNDGLFRAGLVDQLHLTICPWLFGGRRAPTITDGLGFGTLAQATPLVLKSRRRIGDELYLVYQREKK